MKNNNSNNRFGDPAIDLEIRHYSLGHPMVDWSPGHCKDTKKKHKQSNKNNSMKEVQQNSIISQKFSKSFSVPLYLLGTIHSPVFHEFRTCSGTHGSFVVPFFYHIICITSFDFCYLIRSKKFSS